MVCNPIKTENGPAWVCGDKKLSPEEKEKVKALMDKLQREDEIKNIEKFAPKFQTVLAAASYLKWLWVWWLSKPEIKKTIPDYIYPRIERIIEDLYGDELEDWERERINKEKNNGNSI